MNSKVVRSSSIILAISFLKRSIGLVSMLILARLLTPEDFGIIAVAALVVHFANIVSSGGVMQFIVQTSEINDDVINTSWTLDIILKLVTVFVIILCYPIMDKLWDAEEIRLAIVVMAPVIFIRSLFNPELHLDRRNLEYGRIFKHDVLQKIVSFVVLIFFALTIKSFWAFIIADIVGTTVGVLYSYKLFKYRPSLSLKNISNQWNFSKWMLGRGYVGYIRAQADVFIVSQYFPLHLVGRYNLSREIAILPAIEVILPALQPLLASFSRCRDNKVELFKQMNLSLLAVCIVVSPLCMFLYFFSDYVVAIVLGEKWIGAEEVMSALTPLLFVYCMGGVVTSIAIAIGKVRALFVYDFISVTMIVLILLYIDNTNLRDFGLTRGVLGLVFTLPILLFLFHSIGRNIAIAISSIVVTLLISYFAIFISSFFELTDILLLDAMLIGIVFTVAYSIFLYVTSYLLKSKVDCWFTVYGVFGKVFGIAHGVCRKLYYKAWTTEKRN